MIASGITGWKANEGIYLRTEDLFGEWETCVNPFLGEGQTNYDTSDSYKNGFWDNRYYPRADKSFLSQSTCIFEYNGESYYMGDRWKDGDYWDDGHLGVKKSTYIWIPINFDRDGNMEISWVDTFNIEPAEIPLPTPSTEAIDVLDTFKDKLTIEKIIDENNVTLRISPINEYVLPILILYEAVYSPDNTLSRLQLFLVQKM